ncbi:hypothetical protein [Mongoliimonas terrestris]|uniref:hypothetical protein n=1 Tax=Mongoliimonas terrestris TaxID=1709001 RepID=UPI0009497B57|nr:hypothetical protein [Mongoliimonas terrestris]
MLVAETAGQLYVYEVLQQAEGYLVRMRDLETGEIDPDAATLFRTAAVAFRFAELAASAERCAVAEALRDGSPASTLCGAGERPEDCRRDVARAEADYRMLSRQFADEGLSAGQLRARAEAESAIIRRALH